MEILDKVIDIRNLARNHGRYRVLSQKSGVSYEWLTKFANGKITNPTVGNVAKLEVFFNA